MGIIRKIRFGAQGCSVAEVTVAASRAASAAAAFLRLVGFEHDNDRNDNTQSSQ